jgi:hypothetical protein
MRWLCLPFKNTIASGDICLFELDPHGRQRSLAEKTMSSLISAELWSKGFAKTADEDRHIARSVVEVLLGSLKASQSSLIEPRVPITPIILYKSNIHIT